MSISASPSPTPTPPSAAPNDDERRFKPITSPCEWIEDYHPGGYHPVHLGDTFNHGRYRVLRKLGDGSYSTVWLVCDTRDGTYVALKILVSEASASTTELQILRHIAKVAPIEASQHVTNLLNEFEHEGPNGTHKCLVFEPMGPSANSMVEELPQFKPRRYGMKVRYPPCMAKRILKKSLQALAFLHRIGVAHGDFQPGNMLFTLRDINSIGEVSLRQDENMESGSISPPVERVDGKKDIWAPRYLCIAQPLTPFTDYDEGFNIKLSDMGGAYFLTSPPQKPVTPAGLRAQELVLTGAVDKTLDIWSFGCLIFQFVTGQPLFCVPWSESKTEQDDDHLLSLNERMGPLPDELFKHWKTSSHYFTPDRKLFNSLLGGVPEEEQPLKLKQVSMEEAFDRTHPDLSEEECRVVKALIRRVLQYDPAKRPPAAEILLDPWFIEEEGVKPDSTRLV